jgi:hypothetical protein
MTLTIDLAPETEERLRAAAEAQGQDVAALVRVLVESAYPPRKPSLLELAGFAAHLRRDDLPPEEIVRQLRTEWDHRP